MSGARIGIVTAGGDAPGLNAAIRAVSRRALDAGDQPVGVCNGWLGLLEDGTLALAQRVSESGLRVVGVPKTVDNDVPGTEVCIGFDSALAVVVEALDRLHTTAASHHQVMVLETMGRDTGWLAALGALAGGGDVVCLPEFPISIDEVAARVDEHRAAGADHVCLQVLGPGSLDAPWTAWAALGDRLGTR